MTVKQFKDKIKYKGVNELVEAYIYLCDKYPYQTRQYALELILKRLGRYKEWGISREAYIEFLYNKLDILK